MADESAFWLPSEFLTDEDLFLTNSTVLNSPGESVNSSTETQSSEDADEFIAELTRHLAHSAIRDRAAKPQEKSWGSMATSPQSTLTGFTGWSSNPPNQEEAALELIYAAAERVAKMRMNTQAQMMNTHTHRPVRRHMELRTPPVRYNASQNHHHNNNQQIQQMKSQLKQAWLNQQQIQNRGRNPAIHHGLLPPLRTQNHRHHHCHGGAGMRAVFLNGTGVKRQSTGTGVFLPRRVGSNSNNAPTTDTRKKQGSSSTVLLPARVVQALNLNINQMNTHPHPHPNHEILVGRRNAAAMAATTTQQRRGGPMSHHEMPLLPQEWTY